MCNLLVVERKAPITVFHRPASSLEAWTITVLAGCRKAGEAVQKQKVTLLSPAWISQLHRNWSTPFACTSHRSAHASLVNVLPRHSSSTEPCSLKMFILICTTYSQMTEIYDGSVCRAMFIFQSSGWFSHFLRPALTSTEFILLWVCRTTVAWAWVQVLLLLVLAHNPALT